MERQDDDTGIQDATASATLPTSSLVTGCQDTVNIGAASSRFETIEQIALVPLSDYQFSVLGESWLHSIDELI